MVRALPVLFMALAALGIVASCSSKSNMRAERQALMQMSRSWAQVAAGGDLERIVSYWADSAIVLPPDQPAVVGKAAIRDYVQHILAIPGFAITWEPERAEIAAAGDLGYLIERSRFSFADSTGTIHTQYGKGITVWKRDSRGVWKCVVDTWNNDPTAQP